MNFEEKRKALVEYMRLKIDEGDWHAVSDCANDLRVLEAYHSIQKPSPEGKVRRVGEAGQDEPEYFQRVELRDSFAVTRAGDKVQI